MFFTFSSTLFNKTLDKKHHPQTIGQMLLKNQDFTKTNATILPFQIHKLSKNCKIQSTFKIN